MANDLLKSLGISRDPRLLARNARTATLLAEGKAVETIEGLSRDGALDPVQRAFVSQAAIQCGFCTPGMVLSVKALLAENPEPTRAEIEDYLGGNICRCTGYWNILDAAEEAARLVRMAERESGAS